MRFKSILNFVYTALIIIVVFSITITALQESFVSQTASFRFLFWKTPNFPMISFIAAAFIVGLFTGLIVALVDNFHNRRIIKDLKKQLEEAQKNTE